MNEEMKALEKNGTLDKVKITRDKRLLRCRILILPIIS